MNRLIRHRASTGGRTLTSVHGIRIPVASSSAYTLRRLGEPNVTSTASAMKASSLRRHYPDQVQRSAPVRRPLSPVLPSSRASSLAQSERNPDGRTRAAAQGPTPPGDDPPRRRSHRQCGRDRPLRPHQPALKVRPAKKHPRIPLAPTSSRRPSHASRSTSHWHRRCLRLPTYSRHRCSGWRQSCPMRQSRVPHSSQWHERVHFGMRWKAELPCLAQQSLWVGNLYQSTPSKEPSRWRSTPWMHS